MADYSVPLKQLRQSNKGLPYELLIEKYRASLSDEERNRFDSLTPLQQTQEIESKIPTTPEFISDTAGNNKLAYSVLKDDPSIKVYTQRHDPILQVPDVYASKLSGHSAEQLPSVLDKDLMADINKDTREMLSQRKSNLRSMTKEDVDIQKLKEKAGVPNMTDKQFYEYAYLNMPDSDRPMAPDEAAFYDKAKDRTKEIFKDSKISPEDSSRAANVLRNKYEYYQPYNKGLRTIDKVVQFLPLPLLSEGAIARQKGLIAPDETGIADSTGRTQAAALTNLASYPALTIPVFGPVVSGALQGTSSSIAKGERPDEHPNETIGNPNTQIPLDYWKDISTGGLLGGVLGGISNKVSSPNRALNKAEKAYEKADPKPIADLNPEFDKYTAMVNAAAKDGTFKWPTIEVRGTEVPIPTNKLNKYPSEMYKVREAIDAALANAESDEARQALLKEWSTDPDLKNFIEREAIRLYGDKYRRNLQFDEGLGALQTEATKNTGGERLMGIPSQSVEGTVTKIPIRENGEPLYNVPEAVFAAVDYDKLGKGALATTTRQFDFPAIIYPDLKTFKRGKYAPLITTDKHNVISTARDAMDEADSYVVDAFKKYRQDPLRYNVDEERANYIQWKSNGTEASNKYFADEFDAKLDRIIRNPNKDPFVYQPYTTMPQIQNKNQNIQRAIADMADPNLRGKLISELRLETNGPRPSLATSLNAINYRLAAAEKQKLKTAFKAMINEGDNSPRRVADLKKKYEAAIRHIDANGPTNPMTVEELVKGLATAFQESAGGRNILSDVEARQQAIAYLGNLENPSKGANAISKARENIKNLKDFSARYNQAMEGITPKEKLEKLKHDIAVAKAGVNNPKTRLKKAPGMIVPKLSTVNTMSDPEKKSYEATLKTGGNPTVNKVLKDYQFLWPILGPNDEARGYGNYMGFDPRFEIPTVYK